MFEIFENCESVFVEKTRAEKASNVNVEVGAILRLFGEDYLRGHGVWRD